MEQNENPNQRKRKKELYSYSTSAKKQVVAEMEAKQWNKFMASHYYEIPVAAIQSWVDEYGTKAEVEKAEVSLSYSKEEKLSALEFENKNLRSILRKNSILLNKFEELIGKLEKEFNTTIQKPKMLII